MKRSAKRRVLILFFLVCLALGGVRACAASSSGKPPTSEEMHKWAEKLFRSARKSSVSKKAPSIPLSGKLILAYHDCYYDEGCGVYGKYDISSKRKDPDPDAPFFQPVYSDGSPIFDVPSSTWADTKKECDWLIVYGGFEVARDKGYYTGGTDRVSIATRVYVIDPKKSRTVVFEDLGTDIPGDVTRNTYGLVDDKKAEAFIRYIITGEKQE